MPPPGPPGKALPSTHCLWAMRPERPVPSPASVFSTELGLFQRLQRVPLSGVPSASHTRGHTAGAEERGDFGEHRGEWSYCAQCVCAATFKSAGSVWLGDCRCTGPVDAGTSLPLRRQEMGRPGRA